MKKRIVAMLMLLSMVAGLLAGCNSGDNTESPGQPENSPGQTESSPVQSGGDSTGNDKEAPMLSEMVAAGTLPALAERLPSEADTYVETTNSPTETPVYGGTMRTNNGGEWYYGPIGEEPLFRLLDDGSVEPNVAKGFDVSDDGLVYTIHLREGMKWSDGTPFTAEDCVYYYNYVLIADVDNATGQVTKSNSTNYYNWYMTTDPADGILKPAQVRYVDDTTFTITLYSPKPTLLQAICIDNKWMFCPKQWYKDIMATDVDKPHWSGETNLKLIGGEGLTTVTEEEALANAAARSSLYTFDDYSMLCSELAHTYWKYAGRPTLRPWVITSTLTDRVLSFERNPYFWKVDAEGRQLPYIDYLECVNMDTGLFAQEMIAGNLDIVGIESTDFPVYKASEAIGNYTVTVELAPNWSTTCLQLNQGYGDPQYAELFGNIDFRHAMSIAVNREEMNELLFSGMLRPGQFAAPEGTSDYIEGAPDKWIEFDVDAANQLLDGIDLISKELNSDGYRTFVGGKRDGEAITIEVETVAANAGESEAIALLAQYYKAIGIQIVESSNTDGSARDQKFYSGDVAMAAYIGNGAGSFNVKLRPDAVSAGRNNVCFTGKYGLEHQDHLTPEAGTPMAELQDATVALTAASTSEELEAAAKRIDQLHFENTWIIGYLVGTDYNYVVNNRIHNFPQGWVKCDELRYLGYGKPYTWFIQE